MDRALDFESKGCGFKSYLACHAIKNATTWQFFMQIFLLSQ